MPEKLLLGDEAVAQAAIDAGIAGAFSYPGTPATEIFEYIERVAQPGISARWSANEKVAYEEALGMSYAGGRALVSMKHVGLNVASDPFMNSALTAARVGFFLEQHRNELMVEEIHLNELESWAPSQPRYLDSRREHGKFISRWNLVVPEYVLNRLWDEPS